MPGTCAHVNLERVLSNEPHPGASSEPVGYKAWMVKAAHRIALAVVLGTLVGCGLPSKDARNLLLNATGTSLLTETDGSQLLFLLNGCDEIPSCADSCAEAFSAAALLSPGDASARKEMRQRLLEPCFKGKNASFRESGATPDDWFVSYYRDYARRAAQKLNASERTQLQTALTKIASQAPAGHPLRILSEPLTP